MVAELKALRIPSFKSIRNAEFDLGPLTLIAGRNGSGKSNVLDALAVLTALADGGSLRNALDGGRDGPVVRGGSDGCAPMGQDTFSLGCGIQIDDDLVNLDITIRVRPVLQIESERLWTRRKKGTKKGEPLEYLRSDPADPDSGDITARWENTKRGPNPPVSMRADQLLTSQVATRVPQTSAAGRKVEEVASAVLDAIRSTFILDPVPHQMREYIPEKDTILRRNAENLSATLARLISTPQRRDELLSMTQSLSESQVANLETVSSELGDVMITIEEQFEGRRRPIPARLMSDGTLRFLAIATAMLDVGVDLNAPDSRTLIVEEIENGLHPSQASLLIERLKSASTVRHVRTLATTHSPAILNALPGDDHAYVVIATRDSDGWTQITRLTDFPDYFEVASRMRIGDAASRDQLRPGNKAEPSIPPALADIF